MARLVYQNTNAPDFSGSLAGFSQMGRMLASAAGATSDLFSALKTSQNDAADRVVAERALRFQDPSTLSQALSNGTLVGDQSGRVSAATLAALGSLPTQRTAQAAALDALENGRVDTAARLGARGDVNQMLDAANRGNMQGMQDRFGTSPAVAALPIEDQIRLSQAGQGIQINDVQRQQAGFRLNQDRMGETRADQLAAASNEVFNNSYDGGTALRAYAQADTHDPRVEAALRQQLASMYPDQFMPGVTPAGAMGSAGGAAGGRPNFSAGGGGGASGGSISRNDLHSRQLMAESAGKPGAVSPKGARGLMQLMPDTAREMEQKMGLPLGSTDTDPAANEAVGRAYMDQMLTRYDGDQTKALAAYNWGMGNVDKWIAAGSDPSKLPKETRDYVSKVLQDNNPLTNPLNAADAVADVTRADTMANANSSNRALEMLAGSSESRADAAKRLTGEGGTFAGYSSGEIANQLRSIEARAKVNPSQAARILEDSLSSRGLIPAIARSNLNPLNWFQTTSVRNAIPANTWDTGLVDAAVEGTSQIRSDGSANRDRQATAQQIQRVNEQTQQLKARLAQVRSRASALNSPALRGEQARLERQLELLNATGNALSNIQETTQRYTATDLKAAENERLARARRAEELLQTRDGATVPNIENMSPMEWQLYSRGLLPDSYFQQPQ